jgi:acyl-CoA dehydrogenase
MCLHRLQVACDDLLNNFPIRWLGKFFRWVIFPWGTAYKKPRDSLYHKIVSQMSTPSEFRNRITQYCFVDKKTDDSMHRIDLALTKIDAIDPIWRKYQKAMRSGTLPPQNNYKDNINVLMKTDILTGEEARDLREFFDLYKEVIKVNEFSFDLSRVVD